MYSSPARPATSVPPSFPSCSGPAIRSSVSPARTARPRRSTAAGAEVRRGELDDLDGLSAGGRRSRRRDPPRLQARGDALRGLPRRGRAPTWPRSRRSARRWQGSEQAVRGHLGHADAGASRASRAAPAPSRTCWRRGPRVDAENAVGRDWPSAGCAPRSCACRRWCTARSITRLRPDPDRHRPREGRRRLRRRRRRTAGRRCTRSTRPAHTGSRWSRPRRDRGCTRSPTRACRSGRSPRPSRSSWACRAQASRPRTRPSTSRSSAASCRWTTPPPAS